MRAGRDGRIAAITPQHSGPARCVVEAQGLMVAPGFIDIKTHSDFTLPYTPRAESKIRQGGRARIAILRASGGSS